MKGKQEWFHTATRFGSNEHRAISEEELSAMVKRELEKVSVVLSSEPGEDQGAEFLREHIFVGLTVIHPLWEVGNVKHFGADDLLIVLKRCSRNQVQVVGVEAFSDQGELMGINIPVTDTDPSHSMFVEEVRLRGGSSFCASYMIDSSAPIS